MFTHNNGTQHYKDKISKLEKEKKELYDELIELKKGLPHTNNYDIVSKLTGIASFNFKYKGSNAWPTEEDYKDIDVFIKSNIDYLKAIKEDAEILLNKLL